MIRQRDAVTLAQLSDELDALRATVTELADRAGIDPPTEPRRPDPSRPIDPEDVRERGRRADRPARSRRGERPGRGRQ